MGESRKIAINLKLKDNVDAPTRLQVDIDECATSPCQNLGRCEDLVGAYRCVCAAGYAGAVCDVDVDECKLGQCQNNASCVDQLNGVICR